MDIARTLNRIDFYVTNCPFNNPWVNLLFIVDITLTQSVIAGSEAIHERAR